MLCSYAGFLTPKQLARSLGFSLCIQPGFGLGPSVPQADPSDPETASKPKRDALRLQITGSRSSYLLDLSPRIKPDPEELPERGGGGCWSVG